MSTPKITKEISNEDESESDTDTPMGRHYEGVTCPHDPSVLGSGLNQLGNFRDRKETIHTSDTNKADT